MVFNNGFQLISYFDIKNFCLFKYVIINVINVILDNDIKFIMKCYICGLSNSGKI